MRRLSPAEQKDLGVFDQAVGDGGVVEDVAPFGEGGIGRNNRAAVLPLAVGLAADELLRMVTGRLKDSLAVQATAIAHQAAPDQNGNHTFCPERPLSLNAPK